MLCVHGHKHKINLLFRTSQVFTGSSQELLTPDGFEPSSQSSTPKRKNVAGTTPVKRRKLESGWKMLRDHMTQAGQSPSIIPWLVTV